MNNPTRSIPLFMIPATATLVVIGQTTAAAVIENLITAYITATAVVKNRPHDPSLNCILTAIYLYIEPMHAVGRPSL